jgi:hypothetical protein
MQPGATACNRGATARNAERQLEKRTHR